MQYIKIKYVKYMYITWIKKYIDRNKSILQSK